MKEKEESPPHSSGNLTNTDIEFRNCSEKGHVRSKCPEKPKNKQFSSKGKAQEVHTSQAHEDYTFSLNVVGEALSRVINEDVASQNTIYISGA